MLFNEQIYVIFFQDAKIVKIFQQVCLNSREKFCMTQVFSWFLTKHMQKSNLFFLMQLQKAKTVKKIFVLFC